MTTVAKADKSRLTNRPMPSICCCGCIGSFRCSNVGCWARIKEASPQNTSKTILTNSRSASIGAPPPREENCSTVWLNSPFRSRQFLSTRPPSLAVYRTTRDEADAVLHDAKMDLDVTETIRELEGEMLKAAEDLKFEKAALLRDQIKELQRMIDGTKPETKPVNYRKSKKRH